MATPEQAVIAKKAEIEKEAELAKSKYAKIIFNYARNNSAYSRTLRIYGLEYIQRIPKAASTKRSDILLAQQFEKYLDLDEVAVNWLSKALEELSVDKELRFKESLEKFRKKKDSYLKTINHASALLIDFQMTISMKDTHPECLLKEKLIELRQKMRSVKIELGRIFLDVFEGTTIMSGMAPEKTEEEMEKEIL